MAKNDCNLQGTTAPQYVAPAGKVRILAFDKNGLLAADTTWTQNDARPVERVGLHTLQAGTLHYPRIGQVFLSSGTKMFVPWPEHAFLTCS